MTSFKMPSKGDLRSRTSTISNAFVSSITPWIYPKSEEVIGIYDKFGIVEGQCAYCLQYGANSVDHYKCLVIRSEPSGYITDIDNLVPCCQKCNSAKGSKSFEDWYDDDRTKARLNELGMTDAQIKERRDIIVNAMKDIKRYDYRQIVGEEKWNEFIERRKKLNALLKENQSFCDELSKEITEYVLKEKLKNSDGECPHSVPYFEKKAYSNDSIGLSTAIM